MRLQSWDVTVQGRPHRVELERNEETGKTLLRVDGRAALKPFSEERGDFPLEIDGRPYLLHVGPGSYSLEDRGSRYTDAAAASPGANLGRITICRGIEHITVVTDQALLRIERLAPGMKMAMMAGSGGGLLGALGAGASLAVAEALVKRLGGTTIDRVVRSFEAMQKPGICRLEHLPPELFRLFSDEADVDTRVMIVPRACVREIDTGWPVKLLVHVTGAEKPVKFEVVDQLQTAAEHLFFAHYPLSQALLSKISVTAPPAAVAPQPARNPAEESSGATAGTASAEVVRRTSLPEIHWTSPFVTSIGRSPAVVAELEADFAVYRQFYPKATVRRPQAEEPLRQLDRGRFELVHLHGTVDPKGRLTDGGGWTLSFKDLVVKLKERETKMLWMASANDSAAARETLDWARGLNFFVVLTVVRGADFAAVLDDALRRHVAGEPLSTILGDLETRSPTRVMFAGRGEMVFLPR